LLEGVKRVKQAVSPTGVVDAALMDNTQKVLELNGVLKKRMSLAEMFDPSFLKV